jgi:hypothetical protein
MLSRVAIVTLRFCSLPLSRTPTIFPLYLLPHAPLFYSPRPPLFTPIRKPYPSQAVTYIISLLWHNHLNFSSYLSQSVKESVAKELAGSTPFLFFLSSFLYLIDITAQILGKLSAPLSPNLPPSPPASRPSSPAPPAKRKLESYDAYDPVKRTRVDGYPEKFIRHQAQPPSRSEPEEGELRDDPTPPVPSSRPPPPPPSSLHSLPIQRPRKNLQRGDPTFHELNERYHNYGRMLKYSGDARHWSTFSPQHKEYRPLSNPPPPNSPYHKHGALIARLELLDALICFTYSIWTTDYSKDACITGSWQTEEAFLNWTKNKWTAENASSERERAFLGLM